MTDVRALLAQERKARQIVHPHAVYSKSGALSCTACGLNIRSDALWEGHLKSANHRKNVTKPGSRPAGTLSSSIAAQNAALPSTNTKKRKIDDVQGEDEQQHKRTLPVDREYEVDGRKKPKSRAVSDMEAEDVPVATKEITNGRAVASAAPAAPAVNSDLTARPDRRQSVPVSQQEAAVTSTAEVDEDEWAAFERDMAPLAPKDYSAATISAAPVSATQLEAEADAHAEHERRRLRDTEADDEKEDEGRRIEEEFEVMEEMEARVRRLKEKREALRLQPGESGPVDTGQSAPILDPTQAQATRPSRHETAAKNASSHASNDNNDNEEDASENEDEDEDEDDWYS